MGNGIQCRCTVDFLTTSSSEPFLATALNPMYLLLSTLSSSELGSVVDVGTEQQRNLVQQLSLRLLRQHCTEGV